MPEPISAEQFKGDLLLLLTETFESVQGIFLDRGTSMFETLAQISAEDASKPIGSRCATIAAQAAHVNFYMEVLEKFLLTGQNERVDWGEIWRTMAAVTPEEWDASRTRLRETYQRLRGVIQNWDHWEQQYAVGGAIGLVAHCAYHLGEIRQATCTIWA